jgi:transcriptional regulator with XRE-family HTH domain
MTIGQRLRKAMQNAGLTQKDLAERTGINEGTVSAIMKGTRKNPGFNTIERLVTGMRATWADLFDEPRIYLTVKDAALASEFSDFLLRLLAADREQKKRQRAEGDDAIEDALDRGTADEVEELPDEPIIEKYDKKGANRAYRVLTDAMIGLGLLPDSVIFARASQYIDAADDRIAVVRLNGRLFLRRVDRSGNRTVLKSANEPRYGEIHVLPNETCDLVAIVIL